MLKLIRATPRIILSLAIVLLPLLFTAGCGLGMDNAARLERGQAAFEENDYRAAIIDAKDILRKEPENRDARLLLGRSSLRANDAATALKELRRAVELGIDRRTVAVELGEAMLALRQFEPLLEEIQPELAQNDSDRLAILRLRGDAMMRLERPASARELYLAALAVDSEDVTAKLGVASSYVAEENYAKARNVLDDTLAIDGKYVQVWLASGSLYLATRDSDAAADNFARALELATATSDNGAETLALTGLVEARLAQRDLAGAKVAAAKLHGLAPDNLSTWYLAARIAYLEKDYETAQAKLQKVLSAAPESRPAKILMGAVHLKRGNLGQAEMYLSSVVATAPDNVKARELLAEIRLRQNRAAEAADILRPVLNSDNADAERGPDDARIRSLIGNIELSMDRPDLARESFLAARRLAPTELSTYLNVARIDMQRGDPDSAREQYRAALEQQPESVEIMVAMASLEARVDNSDAAMKIAKDLQLGHPDNAIPVALEAELLAADKKYSQSATVYGRALALAKNDRRLALRAFRVRSLGDLDDPVAPLLDYLDERPLDAKLRLVVAQDYQSRGESERAIEEYEQVLSTVPDNLVALNNLAWEYFQNGDARAEKMARRAFEQAPRNGSVADTLGWIQVKKGSLVEGIATLRDAVEFSEGNAEIRYHLAVGLAAAGDKDEARRILNETLADAKSFTSRRQAEQLLASL